MRNRWKLSTLGKVCEIKPPKKEAKERLSATDLVSFVPMNDLGIRQKEFKPLEKRPLSKVTGSYTYFADGDVLLAKITPCFENGKLGIANNLTNGVGFGSSEFIVFRPKGVIESEYLFYFFSQDSFRNSGASVMSGAVGHKRIPKDFIENCPIPLPTLPEQKRIVAILDEAFAGIERAVANTEKNLANAEEFFQNFLNSLFYQQKEKWGLALVQDVCESITDCVNKTAPQVDSPTPFKMIRTTNIRNGKIKLDNVKYVKQEIYKKWTRRQIPEFGDVVLTREAPLGEVGIIETNEKVFLGQRLVSYRANQNKLDNRYLLYGFQSEFVQNQIFALASGSTVQHMRVPDSKKLQIPLPPLFVQKESAELFDQMRNQTKNLVSIFNEKLAALSELKQSLLQKAFSGELTADPDRALKEAAA